MRRGFHAPGRFFQKFCGQRGKKCPFTGAREAGWRERQEGQSPKKRNGARIFAGKGPGARCVRRSVAFRKPCGKGILPKAWGIPAGTGCLRRLRDRKINENPTQDHGFGNPASQQKRPWHRNGPGSKKSGERKPPPFVRPGVRAAEAALLRNGLRRQERHLVFERNSRENR